MLPTEHSGQRLILRFYNDPLSRPLPKLRLSSPKLLPIPTDHQSGLLLPSLRLIFVFTHNGLLTGKSRAKTHLHAYVSGSMERATHGTQWGSLSRKAALSFQYLESSAKGCSLVAAAQPKA